MRKTFAFFIGLWAFTAAGQTLPKPPVQPAKPPLFSSSRSARAGSAATLANEQDISGKLVEAFDSWQPGQRVKIPFSNGLLKGTVKSIFHKNPSVTVMFLEVTNYQKALMTLTQKKSSQQRIFYGTVHHPDYSDALILKNTNNTYSFQTVQQSEVITD